MLVTQQTTLESQGKKIGDLESYIDTLLSKVIEVAPVVLQKDIRNAMITRISSNKKENGYFQFFCQISKSIQATEKYNISFQSCRKIV